MKTIVLASNNKHKIKEIKEILGNVNILSLEEIGYRDEIEETGSTFEENATIKAEAIHKFLKEKNLSYPVMADDSGLCCEGLNGSPGVYSARYAGNHDDKANREKVIKELKGKTKEAYFVCDIVYIDEEGKKKNYVGKTYGEIIEEEKGRTDFGYDCIFYSKDLKKTFGEAEEEEKNEVSHRRRAIEELKKEL